ncbi:type III-B CRISPR module-associated protein Cmr5 [Exiguobacterium sp. KRL4]|uniref:type III-B CRISPR module-associated protein Cmr5 n=1 Tax=Exiguobacterium sp. KRL4 TaxID=1914536 RepID=UPI0008F7F75D|nr:type III-B CRISPR module-associated protein Cmr5 [Exiguobacterium sp. KRL4]OIN65734.1 type III-B CRISPR module-associated protein Cmr5 [Exiguobacterium sp. KRL4]
MNTLHSIDQLRAGFSYDAIQIAKESSAKQSEVKSYIKKMPLLIKTNGLAQTLAFYRAKGTGSKSYQIVYEMLSTWFRAETPFKMMTTEDGFLEQVIRLDTRQYMLLTDETILLLNWLRRFADIELKKEG